VPASSPQKPAAFVTRFHSMPSRDRTEQRRDEKSEKRLDVIHYAGKSHHQVRRADTDEQSNERAPPAHRNVVLVGSVLT